MLVNICVLVAFGIFFVALLKAFRHRHTVSSRITILLAGICFSSCFLFFPCYWELSHVALQAEGLSYPPGFRAVAYTLYYSLKAISGGQEIDVVETMVLSSAPWVVRWIYFALNYVFLVAAPLLTSSLVISLIGDLADQFRCWVYTRRKYHVFSELNHHTLALAERIREKYPKEMLVFCNTKQAEKEQLACVRTMGAVALYASCAAAKLRFRNKQIQFYLVCSDEDMNLRQAEELICKYRDKPQGNYIINAFAESGSGIQMVENMERGNVGVRFLDATALLCSNLLLKYPLHRLPQGCDTISVMIVGCDKMGMRMLKTISWCGVMDGCRLKIRVYDKDAAFLREKLAAQCPELMENCDVSFVAVDARTTDLQKRVFDSREGSPDATYIVMAMGDDELNMEVAERLSRLFRHHNRYDRMPWILTRIRNSTKSAVYREQENPYLRKRRICPFGGVEDIFAEGILHHTYLDNLAFAVDLSYNRLLPEQDPLGMTDRELRTYFSCEPVRSARSRFLQSEYNRRSSTAAALHILVKLRGCGVLPGAQNIPTADTIRSFRMLLAENPDLLNALARNEHQRWNRFMRSEGYVRATWEDLLSFYPVLEKKNNQDILSKRHLCLVEWEELDALNELYLSLDPPVKKNFKQNDFNLIRDIPGILGLANRMEALLPEDFT